MRVQDLGVFRVGIDEFPFVVAEYLPLTLAELIRADSASIAQKAKLCAPASIGAELLGGTNAAGGSS
jgi:hypothetical protein